MQQIDAQLVVCLVGGNVMACKWSESAIHTYKYTRLLMCPSRAAVHSAGVTLAGNLARYICFGFFSSEIRDLSSRRSTVSQLARLRFFTESIGPAYANESHQCNAGRQPVATAAFATPATAVIPGAN